MHKGHSHFQHRAYLETLIQASRPIANRKCHLSQSALYLSFYGGYKFHVFRTNEFRKCIHEKLQCTLIWCAFATWRRCLLEVNLAFAKCKIRGALVWCKLRKQLLHVSGSVIFPIASGHILRISGSITAKGDMAISSTSLSLDIHSRAEGDYSQWSFSRIPEHQKEEVTLPIAICLEYQ